MLCQLFLNVTYKFNVHETHLKKKAIYGGQIWPILYIKLFYTFLKTKNAFQS